MNDGRPDLVVADSRPGSQGDPNDGFTVLLNVTKKKAQ